MPLRTTQRKASRIISSSHGCQAMKRMPVVMKLRSVVGIAWLTSRMRSQGSSLWKRTDTAMCVLDVKSRAWKPTRSIVGAIDSTSGVVRPVALHRLWLPSRVVVSTMSTKCVPPRGIQPRVLMAHVDVQSRVTDRLLKPVRGDPTVDEVVMVEHGREQAAVGLHSLGLQALERLVHDLDRLVAVAGV